MDIAPSSIVWDIGAGSGSVSIEAAQMAHDGQVFAIEMDPEDHGLIKQNAERFGVANVQAILGRAPEACDELLDPDAVFIAGGGREVTRISEYAYKRLRAGGRLVVNVVSIDHLAELREALSRPLTLDPRPSTTAAPDINVWLINLSRTTNQLERLSFDPLKPSFLLAVTK